MVSFEHVIFAPASSSPLVHLTPTSSCKPQFNTTHVENHVISRLWFCTVVLKQSFSRCHFSLLYQDQKKLMAEN